MDARLNRTRHAEHEPIVILGMSPFDCVQINNIKIKRFKWYVAADGAAADNDEDCYCLFY